MHSNGRDFGYYQKIEKYYPDGSTRYFYTKEQWDAYQRGLELQKQAKLHNQQVENYNKNKAADEAQSKQKQDSSTIAMRKEHPDWFNSKNVYVEPVKDIYAELNSSSKNESRIYQTSLVEFLWTLGDRNYRDEYDDDNVKTRWNKYKERVFNDVDEIYNKEDSKKIKELINNLEDDQRNIVKYMKDAKEDDYYKNHLKTDNMHKMLSDAINRQKVDDKEFRSEDAAVKYALNQIEDYIMHVYYDFIEKDAKAKDFYNRYEPNTIGKNDELGFRKNLLKRLKYEVKKEILESFPKEVAKKYLPKEEDFWKH